MYVRYYYQLYGHLYQLNNGGHAQKAQTVYGIYHKQINYYKISCAMNLLGSMGSLGSTKSVLRSKLALVCAKGLHNCSTLPCWHCTNVLILKHSHS